MDTKVRTKASVMVAFLLRVLLFGVNAVRAATPASFHPLGYLDGGGYCSVATEVAPDGSYVRGYSDSTYGYKQFEWTEGDGNESGGMVPLGDVITPPYPGHLFGQDGEYYLLPEIDSMINRCKSHAVNVNVTTDAAAEIVGSYLNSSTAINFDFTFGTENTVQVNFGTAGSADSDEHWSMYEVAGAINTASQSESSYNAAAVVYDPNAATYTLRLAAKEATWQSLVIYLDDDSTLDKDNWSFTYGSYGGEWLAETPDGSVKVGMGKRAVIGWAGARDYLVEYLLEDYGFDMSGWYLHAAEGVSDDGKVIAGHGINPDGIEEAWALILPDGSVEGRWVFYNNSAFDGGDPNANAADDDAIDPSKSALLSGETATFDNYISYVKGINGIMIDIAGLPDPNNLTSDDFDIRSGNDHENPWTWDAGPSPSSITVRPGAGVGGSDRVTLIFPDTDANNSKWMLVMVHPNANTGLPAPDVFYFGLAIGETGNSSTDTYVNATDRLGTRANPHSGFDPAPVDDAYDFNRDKNVNASDRLIQRAHPAHFLNCLKLITAP